MTLFWRRSHEQEGNRSQEETQDSKGRWKSVERSAAAELSRIYSDVGKSPVFRVPVNGREGPDITINEVGLVINVKSRQRIPERLFPRKNEITRIGDLVCFRLEGLAHFGNLHENIETDPHKGLTDWYEFMDKWTKQFSPTGISSIFLHRPRMPIGNIGVVIHINDLKRLSCQLSKV